MHLNSNVKETKAIFAIIVSCLLYLISADLFSQESGFKYFRNYGYKEYDHQAQNWGIAQDRDGLIYAANHGGVLIYDGASWELIDVPNYTVRSLDIAENGTVFIGGVGEIGYLTANLEGSLRYVSLLEHIADDQKNFSNVWRTHAAREGIYFRTSNRLFRWHSGNMKVWGNRSFRSSFVINGQFYVQQEGVGLMQDINGALTPLPGGETFAKERIWLLVPYDTGADSPTLLIGTRSRGFFLYDGSKARPFPIDAELDDYLKNNPLYNGIRLSGGDFALATSHGGLVIMNPRGRLQTIFDKTSGLQDADVRWVFEDIYGSLWLALNRGISRIEYRSPFFHHDERSGLPGMVLALVRHQGDLYVGTSEGLYVLGAQAKTFRPIPGMRSSCWSLLSMEQTLLAASSGGLFRLDSTNGSPQKILEGKSFFLLASDACPGSTWCGTGRGLAVIKQNDNRRLAVRRFETVAQDIRFIEEDKNGQLWLLTSAGDVLRVDVQGNTIDLPVKPEGLVYYAARAANHVIFATDRGLYHFDEENRTFVPDFTLGKQFAAGPEGQPVFRIVEDRAKNIWFHSESRNYRAIPDPAGTYTIVSRPFLRIPISQVNTIYPDPDGDKTWFASFDGLIGYDTKIVSSHRQDFQILLRKVTANNRLIFDNYQKTSAGGALPILAYNNRDLSFEFAAPFFEAENRIQYRSFLEGYDKGWADWNRDNKRIYTNLDAGLYTFKVKARNVYGHDSSEAVFRFKVLAPWYNTWWAFMLYGSAFVLLVFLVVKWRSSRLEIEKKKLEQVIKERTREINGKNRQLEEQTLQLTDQSEKLKEMDHVKSRFFANISHEFRTPLTLIMGPLEQILAEAQDKRLQKRVRVMLNNSRRLLGLINQLLDLSKLDSGKMTLQARSQDIVPFLQGVAASFDWLARQNNLDLTFGSDRDKVFVVFDPEKMEKVIGNLLANAVKFTPPGGRIEVSLRTDSDLVEISVKDTGIGIPGTQLPHIFDRFYQVNDEDIGDHDRRGTGIGLALTKELVALHGGRIDVHSTAGKGSEFIIRLPLGERRPDAEEGDIPYIPHPGFDEIIEEEEPAPGDETGDTAAVPDDRPVILVVEDNADMRHYIREPLESTYKVVEAADGNAGIAKAKEIIPDLVVSDIMMPKADGYELCRELKKDIDTSHVPIILLTAKASEESIIQGLKTGADDYITKPFSSRMLISRIENLIDLRRQLQLKIQRQKMLLPAEIQVSSLDDEFLKKFQGFIEENLDDPEFTIDILCEKLDMGRSTLFKKIRALTGETPNQFILSYRLERGAQLLKDKSRSVTDAAMAVGFSSPAYFASCFKDKFHQSPSDYQSSQSQPS